MSGEFNVYGVFVPALLVWAMFAFAVSALIRRLFERLGVYRFVWHRPLFDFSLLIIILGGITALVRMLA